MPPKYITTYEKKEIPLGEVSHKYSRDAVARMAEGQKVADRMQTITRKVTTLNPDWVKAQPTAKPAGKAPVVGKPAAPGEESWGQQIVGGVRQAIGLPREGLGPGLVGGVRNALGMPADGIGPGIQRFVTGLGQPSPSRPTSTYYTNPVAFGQAAVSQSGDTSSGNQLEAAERRAMGDAMRASQAARR